MAERFFVAEDPVRPGEAYAVLVYEQPASPSLRRQLVSWLYDGAVIRVVSRETMESMVRAYAARKAIERCGPRRA